MRRGLPKPGAPLGSPLSPLTPSVGRGNSAVFTLQLTGTPLSKAKTRIFAASGPSTTRVAPISNIAIPSLLPNASVPSPVPLSVARDPLRYDHPGFLRSRPLAGDPAPGSPSGERGRKEGYRPRRSPHLHPRPRHPGQIKEPTPGGERDPAPEKSGRSPCGTGVRTTDRGSRTPGFPKRVADGRKTEARCLG